MNEDRKEKINNEWTREEGMAKETKLSESIPGRQLSSSPQARAAGELYR